MAAGPPPFVTRCAPLVTVSLPLVENRLRPAVGPPRFSVPQSGIAGPAFPLPTHRLSFSPMTNTRFFSLTVSLLLLVLAGLPAQAQPMWKQAFGYQMDVLLRSPDPVVQAGALKVFIEVAGQNDRDIVLWPATNALLDVYETSPLRAHRQMAIAALGKMDRTYAYTALLDKALTEPDEGLRRMILQAAAGSRSIEWAPVATAYNLLLQTSTAAEPVLTPAP